LDTIAICFDIEIFQKRIEEEEERNKGIDIIKKFKIEETFWSELNQSENISQRANCLI
jgi:hypothetical protein